MAERRTSNRVSKLNPKYYGGTWELAKKKKQFVVSKPKSPEPPSAVVPVAPERPSVAPVVPPTSSAVAESEAQNSDSQSEAESSEEEDDDESDDEPFEEPLLQQPKSEEEEIALVQKLYKDLSFSGSFSGIQTLRRCILKEKGINVSQRIVAKALNLFPSYVTHLNAIKSYPTSHYHVTALGQLMQVYSIAFELRCCFNTIFLTIGRSGICRRQT